MLRGCAYGIVTLLLMVAEVCASLMITSPVEGGWYAGNSLDVRVVVDFGSQKAGLIQCRLNDGPPQDMSRLCTDWPTYMQNGLHTGFSHSPAVIEDQVLWMAPVTGYYHEFCGPVVVDGIVYYVSDETSMAFALDAIDGSILWSYDVVSHVDGAVTVQDGRVFIAADSAWCLDALTGERLWAFSGVPGLHMNGCPSVADGLVYFLNANIPHAYYGCHVFALDQEAGSVVWQTYLPYYSTGSTTVWNGMLFLPTDDGPLYALDALSGKLIWEQNEIGGFWDTSPTIVDGVLFIGGRDSRVHALDAFSGDMIWESDPLPYSSLEPTPAVAYGKVFAGCTPYWFDGGRVVALDQQTGKTVWSMEGELHGSVAIGGGLVYWNECRGDSIRAVDARTGELRWGHQVQAGVYGMQSSPALVDGVLYVAATDGYLYALGSGLKFSYERTIMSSRRENELVVSAWTESGELIGCDTTHFQLAGTHNDPIQVPRQLALLPNVPNPFNGQTRLIYEVERADHVRLRVFDTAGRLVRTLQEGPQTVGRHERLFDAQGLSSGVYIARLELGTSVVCRRLLLIK